MLEKIDLDKIIERDVYKTQLKVLQKRLSQLQLLLKEKNIPVLVYFEGWSASGKGTLMSKLLYPLDPRYFDVHTMSKVTQDMKMRPYLWSYFSSTPLKGRISMFDQGWIRGMCPKYMTDWDLSKLEYENFYYHINSFEKQLSDDGTVILKFFLHLSADEQRKRFKELEKNPETKWRIDSDDWEQNKNYDKCLKLFEKIIENTNVSQCQWNIIEATDKRFATIKVYNIVIDRLEEEIKRREENTVSHMIQDTKSDFSQISILSKANLSKTIDNDKYKLQLSKLQNKLSSLCFKLYSKRKSVIVVYEGWDAAGKGGNIKRLTQELDPRGFAVIPIAAPTREELNHHYLWRFYKKLPKDGHTAIFDRSWYGRVLVERIESYCSPQEWQRAYREINDMEKHISDHGTSIFKFWINIDKDEQLRRFKARQSEPLKQWKITEEDWRNREKWTLYEKAVDEMLFRTNTEYAPWTIVESNDKKYARIKTLEIITSNLEEKLN